MSILSLPNSTINGSLADKINSTVATSSWPSSKLWQLTTLNLKSVIIALIDLFILNLKNRLNCELDETFLLGIGRLAEERPVHSGGGEEQRSFQHTNSVEIIASEPAVGTCAVWSWMMPTADGR